MKHSFMSWLALLALSACAQTQLPAETATQDEAVVSAAPPAIAPNSTALERYQPLGLVKGDLRPLVEDTEARIADPEAVFADAIAYARDTQSYALLIWHGGALQLEKYFEPYTAEIRPEPASMHKSVLGLALAKALTDGLIESADAPASTWLPEWEGDPRGEITLRQLLTMSSGLAPLSYQGGVDSPALRFASGADDPVEVLLELPLEAGTEPHFHYQNTVTQLLMLVLERAIGQPYKDFLSREIWQPLGAADAYTYDFASGGLSRGYASFLARPLDWLRLGLLIKNDGASGGVQIIAPEAIADMTAPSALNPNYGWQIWRGATWQAERFYNEERAGFAALSSAPYLTDDVIFFDGYGGQRVYISKSEDLVIVRLGDTKLDWDDAILPNAVIEALQKP